MLAAFVYQTYYMWEIKKNFRGLYKDFEQLEELLSGTSEYSNLETFNIETLEFHKYEWVNYYKVEDCPEPYTKDSYGQICEHLLVQVYPGYGNEPEKIPFTYEYLTNTTNSAAKMKYYSGYWQRNE